MHAYVATTCQHLSAIPSFTAHTDMVERESMLWGAFGFFYWGFKLDVICE
jgi:hypothetical protein